VTLVVSPEAARSLRRCPRKVAEKVLDEMEKIAADPFGKHPKAKRLAGSSSFRLRVGDWRALYTVDIGLARVALVDVLHRSEAYR